MHCGVIMDFGSATQMGPGSRDNSDDGAATAANTHDDVTSATSGSSETVLALGSRPGSNYVTQASDFSLAIDSRHSTRQPRLSEKGRSYAQTMTKNKLKPVVGDLKRLLAHGAKLVCESQPSIEEIKRTEMEAEEVFQAVVDLVTEYETLGEPLDGIDVETLRNELTSFSLRVISVSQPVSGLVARHDEDCRSGVSRTSRVSKASRASGASRRSRLENEIQELHTRTKYKVKELQAEGELLALQHQSELLSRQNAIDLQRLKKQNELRELRETAELREEIMKKTQELEQTESDDDTSTCSRRSLLAESAKRYVTPPEHIANPAPLGVKSEGQSLPASRHLQYVNPPVSFPPPPHPYAHPATTLGPRGGSFPAPPLPQGPLPAFPSSQGSLPFPPQPHPHLGFPPPVQGSRVDPPARVLIPGAQPPTDSYQQTHRNLPPSFHAPPTTSSLPPTSTFVDVTDAAGVCDHNGRISTGGPAELGAQRQVDSRMEPGLHPLVHTLVQAVTANRMPIPEPSVFDGNPMSYPDWIFQFKSLVDNRGLSVSEKIQYLNRYTSGAAKEAVGGFFVLRSEDAYLQAMKVLERRYGDPLLISESFRAKLDAWPRIKNKDKKAIRQYSDFLLQCTAAMKEVETLSILNDVREVKKASSKLPDFLQHAWDRRTALVRREESRFMTFPELARYIQEESEVLNDPILGLVTSSQPTDAPRVPKTGTKMVFSTDTGGGSEEPPPPPPRQCRFCKTDTHSTQYCRHLEGKSYEERSEWVKGERLCFGCLQPGHVSKACTRRATCKRCKRNHPTSLHGRPTSNPSERNGEGGESSQNTGEASCHRVKGTSKSTLTSMVVPVLISSDQSPDREIPVYALLDTMSDTTFLSTEVSKDLHSKPEPAVLRLVTMSDQVSTVRCGRHTGLRVRGVGSSDMIHLPTAFSRDEIPLDRSHIPCRETAKSWPHLEHLQDKLTDKLDCPIGLLIGYDCAQALAPLACVSGKAGEPFAVQTRLGWSIVGKHDHSTSSFDSIGPSHRTVAVRFTTGLSDSNEAQGIAFTQSVRVHEVTPSDLLSLLEGDFRDSHVDGLGMSQEDKQFLDILNTTITQRPDGHYEMPLPLRTRPPPLCDNRHVALRRLLALKRQLEKRPLYFQHYLCFMNEILERGDAEPVPQSELNNPGRWYIPHHGVYHPQKPNKVRVVFDCSARFQDTSLNDQLLQGPDLINSLVGVLCRFRDGPVAFSCDVEKMFHQFKVSESDQDYLRFLWWKDGELDSPPVDFRMKVHLFGATSSPGCANFGLKRLADDHRDIGEGAADFLKNDFYVDDGLKAERSVEDAIDLLAKARAICARGGLRLHKIVSNSPEVMGSVPQSELGQVSLANLGHVRDGAATERTLGLLWCVRSDTFRFEVKPKENPLTRRGILSAVASVYDPLGFIAPVILVGRQILQEVCRRGCGWDEPVTPEVAGRWHEWERELQELRSLAIPRCHYPKDFTDLVSVQLHHFSDASTRGYGQCSYLRVVNVDGRVYVALVMAKAKVTPLKLVTVPRLELQAAVLSVQVARKLEAELKFPSVSHHFWTDSQVVLGYIQNDISRYHVFVANRVTQIREFSQPSQWNHVPTGVNPADLASRGAAVGDLEKLRWFSGPEMLMSSETQPPPAVFPLLPDDKEVRKVTTHSVQASPLDFDRRFRRFSSYETLLRAVGVLIRRCDRGATSTSEDPVAQRSRAEMVLLRMVQREAYGPKGESALNSTSLKPLDPFIDELGMLRVGGRLRRASLEYGVKHPVVIPRSSWVATLLVRFCHERVFHQGRGLTINEIRSRGYWIIGCRRLVSSLIHDCVTCKKLRGKLGAQKMADLPEVRAEATPPFTHCGIDCFGPFLVKEGRREVKKYGLVITCLALRAIHIELLEDLSTDAFILGLRCFIALRGKVRSLYCDRGTNFVGASHELKMGLETLDEGKLGKKLAEQNCNFHFNPPSASHMGGVWERQIRSIRAVLNGMLTGSASRLDVATLRALLYEVAAVVNSRPLTVEHLCSPSDPMPLSPNNLLTCKTGVVVPPPPGTFEREDLYLKRRWKKVQYLSNEFWARWRKEYLYLLQPRNTWKLPAANAQVGDIVLMKDELSPRGQWPLATILQTFPGEDGLVRKVRLQVANAHLDHRGKRQRDATVLERPIHKLVPLLPTPSPSLRPQRPAAERNAASEPPANFASASDASPSEEETRSSCA